MGQDTGVQVRKKNRTLNQWEQYYRSDALASFPTYIQFPTGTRCNLRCRFCTERDGQGVGKYEYRDLSFQQFSEIVSESQWRKALRSLATIALYGWGEPLFNRDYGQIADYLLEGFPGIGISISSNGVLFDRTWAKKFVEAASADLNFSVNAATPQTFLRLTGSKLFATVVENIGYLTALRRSKGKPSPAVTLSFVATTENVQELPLFVELAAELKVDSVIVQDVMTLNEETSRLTLANQPELARAMFQMAAERARELGVKIGFISFETHLQPYFPTTAEMCTEQATAGPKGDTGQKIQDAGGTPEQNLVPSPYRLRTDCFDPWERFMVRADGEVFPCCRSQSFPGFTLGNVFDEGFQEIWNGEGYRHLRQTVNSATPPEVCAVCPRKAGLD